MENSREKLFLFEFATLILAAALAYALAILANMATWPLVANSSSTGGLLEGFFLLLCTRPILGILLTSLIFEMGHRFFFKDVPPRKSRIGMIATSAVVNYLVIFIQYPFLFAFLQELISTS